VVLRLPVSEFLDILKTTVAGFLRLICPRIQSILQRYKPEKSKPQLCSLKFLSRLKRMETTPLITSDVREDNRKKKISAQDFCFLIKWVEAYLNRYPDEDPGLKSRIEQWLKKPSDDLRRCCISCERYVLHRNTRAIGSPAWFYYGHVSAFRRRLARRVFGAKTGLRGDRPEIFSPCYLCWYLLNLRFVVAEGGAKMIGMRWLREEEEI
jgi:hypothetical protein